MSVHLVNSWLHLVLSSSPTLTLYKSAIWQQWVIIDFDFPPDLAYRRLQHGCCRKEHVWSILWGWQLYNPVHLWSQRQGKTYHLFLAGKLKAWTFSSWRWMKDHQLKDLISSFSESCPIIWMYKTIFQLSYLTTHVTCNVLRMLLTKNVINIH